MFPILFHNHLIRENWIFFLVNSFFFLGLPFSFSASRSISKRVKSCVHTALPRPNNITGMLLLSDDNRLLLLRFISCIVGSHRVKQKHIHTVEPWNDRLWVQIKVLHPSYSAFVKVLIGRVLKIVSWWVD